jgi:hypothetical protein
MLRSSTALQESAPSVEIDDREAREMAMFLVRIFGEEASDVVAERSQKSEQKEDWQRVGGEVEKLLDDDQLRDDPRPLRLFP